MSGAVIIWARLFLKIEKSPSFQFQENIGGCALIIILNSISRWSEEKSSGWTLQFRIRFAVSPVAIVKSIVDAARLHVVKVGWVPFFLWCFCWRLNPPRPHLFCSSLCFPKGCSMSSCRRRLEPPCSSSRSIPAAVRKQPARHLVEEYPYRQILQQCFWCCWYLSPIGRRRCPCHRTPSWAICGETWRHIWPPWGHHSCCRRWAFENSQSRQFSPCRLAAPVSRAENLLTPLYANWAWDEPGKRLHSRVLFAN